MHASSAFFVAVADFIMFGIALKPSQILGMLVIVGCIVCICLSTIGNKKSEQIVQEPILPVYVPILFSLTVPLAQALTIIITKRVTIVKKVIGRDFTFAYLFVMGFVLFTQMVLSFYFFDGSMDWYYFKLGVIGSSFNIFGIICLNFAASTGNAADSCNAIVSCQMILLSIASS